MEGILKAIRSLFKKDEEEIPKVQMPYKPINIPQLKIDTQPQPIPLKPEVVAAQKPNILQPEYWKPTPNVRARDVIRELPGAAGEVGKSIIQSISRNLVSAAKTLGGSYEPSQAKGPVGEFFLGKEPVYTVGERSTELSKNLETGKYGVKLPPKIALPVAAGLVIGDVALDMPGVNIPLGEGKKGLKPIIESADELVSIASKQFKKKAGESVRVPVIDFFKSLSKKFDLSDEVLDALDKGPIAGNNFSIEKTGKYLEFIFDEGFRPLKKVIENLKKPMPKIVEKEIKQGINIAKKPVVKTVNGFINKEGQLVPVGQHNEAAYKEFKEAVDKESALTELMTRGNIRSVITPEEANFEIIGQPTGNQLNQIMKQSKNKIVNLDITDTNGKVISSFTFGNEDDLLKGLKENFNIEKTVKPISRNTNKTEFDAINREANAYLKEKYSLKTTTQYAGTEVSAMSKNEKAQLKLMKEAGNEFAEDLVSVEGKGGIKVPFSDLDYMNWKDKDILLLNRETPMRNIEDVAGADASKLKEFLFDKITKATADLENFVRTTKMGIEDTIIKKLEIKPNSVEDKLIMRFGEGRMTKEELMAATPTKWQQVMEADQYFRKLYDDILTKVNDTITQYGYDPVLKRNDYYTHYQEIGNLFQQLGNITRSERLPAWLNGLTADFKPGKQFFKFAQPRVGGQFTESAIGAFENYLYPASRQIYYTDSIQRGRALWNTLAEAIQKNEDMPPTHLSDFMAWLNDRTNLLSGKKSLMARGTEGMIGRKAYSLVNTITKQASSNLIAGNVSAALTNWIPLTQAAATTNKKSFVKGLVNAMTNPLTEANNFTIDGVQSSFLRRRFPYRDLSQTLWESTKDKMGWLFYTIDKFTSNAVTSGKYFEGIAKGQAPEAAMKVADEYAARLIGDRSFGQMPTVFENQGLLKLMTMFQLEVNNQLSFIFKDAAKYSGAEGNPFKTAATLGEIALYSHVFNNVFEWATGRRPAFDPIYIVLKSYDIWTSDNAPVNQKATNTAKVVMDNLPFLSILTGGGRIPVAAGIPSPQDIIESPLKATAKFGLTYLPPAGGYQAYKSMEGMESYIRGYTQTPTGRVKYPIEKDFDNLLRSALFGQYSSPEAGKYYEGGETALGDKQAEIFKMLHSQDPKLATDYYNRVHLQRDVNAHIENLKKTVESMREQLINPETSVAAKEKINQMAVQTKTEVVNLLNDTPETEGLLDVFFGKLGELIKTIIGGPQVEASEVEGLKVAGTTPQPTGAFKGVSDMVGKTPLVGGFPGISSIATKASIKTGVSTKKGSTKKYTPKKLALTMPKIKEYQPAPLNIKPIIKPTIKLRTPAKKNKRVGITFGKITKPKLKRSDYI